MAKPEDEDPRMKGHSDEEAEIASTRHLCDEFEDIMSVTIPMVDDAAEKVRGIASGLMMRELTELAGVKAQLASLRRKVARMKP